MNDIRRFLNLRDSLMQERAKLETRLREINQALGESNLSTSQESPTLPAKGAAKRGGRRAGGISLREAVLQVTSKGPLSKEDILNGVKQLGYRFSTSNPLNSLGVILYGKNPKFKNDGGRFSPAGNAASNSRTQASKTSAPSKSGGQRRKLSPEARERIAAAQRARWAKSKADK